MLKGISTVLFTLCCALISSAVFGIYNVEGIKIYQKNFHLSEAHKQSLADDIDRYHNADNMWDILRSEFILCHYENNPEVQKQIQFFLGNRDFLLHSAQRAAPYLYYISQQVKKRRLPAELVLLPMIESAYNPFAYSSAGAGGIWQMMPDTASGFGIKKNWWYDGRRDIIASTKAALDYLVYLGGFFDGNWLLALAAYNTGEGNVLAAIHRNIRDNVNTNFWSLPLSQQTREYVPRLLALAIIISHPEQYPIEFPPVHNAPYLAQVDVGGQIDLNHAAWLAGLSLAALKQLNPGYNRTATDPNGPYKLILPIENVEQFTENLLESPLYAQIRARRTAIKSNYRFTSYALQAGDTLYITRYGDNLKKIASKFHLSINTLAAVNSLKNITSLPTGTQLIIPTHLRKNTTQKYQLISGDTIYIVRNGDNVEKIAKKFHTTPSNIRLANLMTHDEVAEGDRLVIPTHRYRYLSTHA